MALSKALQQFKDAAKANDAYWVEETKLHFALTLHERSRQAGINNKTLADRLKTSPAYITKVFRGDANLTIESMVKLARAIGLKLSIQLVDDGLYITHTQPFAWGKFQPRKPSTTLVSDTSVMVEADIVEDFRRAA
jgi:ribosome-binding protein aMBF1 (putative translation factor)